MIKDFFRRLLVRRHFWRYASYSEVSELYMSRMLRMAAISIVGSFISIYLFQSGFSVVEIALYWAAFYLFKVFVTLPVSSFVGWVGPKRSTLISNILYIPSMICFALVPEFGPWLLIPTLITQGISASMYSVAYLIDFSKVKSAKHAGKEIGYMNIIAKCTAGISPLIGGGLAFWFGPQVVIVISAILFIFAAAPLMRTGEHVETRIKLKFKAFPWKLLYRQTWSELAVGHDVFATGTAWSLFTAIFIIGMGSDDSVYAVTGILLSVVFFTALAASYAFGRIIDRKKGKELMHFGAIAKAATHFFRPFIVTPIGAAGLNAANEVGTTAYALPHTRAVFDNADISGARTTYLGFVELIANFGAFTAALGLAVAVSLAGDMVGFQAFFLLAGLVVLLILTSRFPLFKK